MTNCTDLNDKVDEDDEIIKLKIRRRRKIVRKGAEEKEMKSAPKVKRNQGDYVKINDQA